MKLILLPLFLLPLSPLLADSLAHDDASQSAYGSEWKSGSNGGTGFGEWTQQTQTSGEGSHAGFYIATTENNSDLNAIASGSKAFGLYANGSAFEAATAYRSLAKPLEPGATFSIQLEHGQFEKKFETDSADAGSIGLTLRNGNASGSTDDYNKGARFEFGFYGGQANYQVYDGETQHDTGVAFTENGVSIKLTLLTADTYDLEITTLPDKKTTKLSNRKLAGSGSIESLCLFDRNGEKADAYFNSLDISKP